MRFRTDQCDLVSPSVALFATVALRELAGVAGQLVTAGALTDDAPQTAKAERARHLNNLSVRLDGVGCREEALSAIEEAVTVYRELAAERPAVFDEPLAVAQAQLEKISRSVAT